MGVIRGGNHSGAKWNKGGAMARKNGITLDFSAFNEYAEMLDNLGADLKAIVEDAMEQSAETIQDDTIAAMADANLPAGGDYSTGDTVDSIIRDAKVEWQGSVGEIRLGFDKTKQGAGGFLITGTPRMRPNYELERIYGSKKYERQIVKDIEQLLQDEIDARRGG